MVGSMETIAPVESRREIDVFLSKADAHSKYGNTSTKEDRQAHTHTLPGQPHGCAKELLDITGTTEAAENHLLEAQRVRSVSLGKPSQSSQTNPLQSGKKYYSILFDLCIMHVMAFRKTFPKGI